MPALMAMIVRSLLGANVTANLGDDIAVIFGPAGLIGPVFF